jgi:hypothetical protein
MHEYGDKQRAHPNSTLYTLQQQYISETVYKTRCIVGKTGDKIEVKVDQNTGKQSGAERIQSKHDL